MISCLTNTRTIEGVVLIAPLSSVTVRLNVNIASSADPIGAVNVGLGELLPLRMTGIPDICLHK